MRLELKIAGRYLAARKSHSAVNIISMVSMAGVAVATVAMVVVMSVFNGFTDLAESRLSHVDPVLKVFPEEGKYIEGADSLATALEELSGVAAAAPVVEDQALAMYHDRQMPVTIKGLPRGYDGVIVDIGRTVIDGVFGADREPDSLALEPPGVSVSIGVALQLGVRPSFFDPLTLYVPRRMARYNPANPAAAFRAEGTIVKGVTEVDQAEYDTDYIYVPLDVARNLLDLDDGATAIELAASPDADLEDVAAAVSKAVGTGYRVVDRRQQQEQAFRMINIEKWVTLLMLAFILVIASFNIISTLSMIIIDKTESITILRALGCSRRMLRRVFMLQGWMVSLIGGIGGIIIGVGLCLAQQYGKFIKISGDPASLSIDAYPVKVLPVDLIIIAAIVATIGAITGLVATRFLPRE
ncbi:MAG: ABC transporter permease [Muribaculaceae bacterium]|nr:ABC transporter permease [Muribaculaceae bacterium]